MRRWRSFVATILRTESRRSGAILAGISAIVAEAFARAYHWIWYSRIGCAIGFLWGAPSRRWTGIRSPSWRGRGLPRIRRIIRRVRVRCPRKLFERALNNAGRSLSVFTVHGPNDQVIDFELQLLPTGEREALFPADIGEKILVVEFGVGFAKPRFVR